MIYFERMENFLKTREGLAYLCETSPSDMPVDAAIDKAKLDYQDAENDYLMRQAEDMYGAGYL